MKTKLFLPLIVAVAAQFSAQAQTMPANPYNLSGGNYTTSAWAATEAANTYPASMRFYFLGTTGEPSLTDTIAENYVSAYNLTSGTRIVGGGAEGFSFINTGSSSLSTNGYKLGAAVLSLNTTGRSDIQVSWTGKTVTPNFRTYVVRLFYRVGSTGNWSAVLDANNNVVEYARNNTSGHTANIPAVTLPGVANNQALVQLQWKYFQIDTNTATGARAQLAVNNINVTSSPYVVVIPSTIHTNVSQLNFHAAVNGNSIVDSVEVSGGNITGAINLTTASPFEISSTATGTFGNTVALNANVDTVAPTYVYVRYSPTAIGTHTGTLTLTAGSATEQVDLNGTAYGSSDPTPIALANDNYTFNTWSATAATGTYPAHTVFQYTTEASPSLIGYPLSGDWHCGYDLASRPRFNGLDNQGVSFINTGSAQYDDCVSGTNANNVFVGGIVAAVNTQNIDSAKMEYTVQVLTLGDGTTPRHYEVRLQYRTGLNEDFRDLTTPVAFSSENKTALDTARVSFNLEQDMLNKANVQFRWLYYDLKVAGSGGTRPSFRLDDVSIKKLEASTSVADKLKQNNSLVLYPNPVKAGTVVNLKVATSGTIIDLSGRTVATFERTQAIATKGIVSGVYIIKTVDGGVSKLVVE